MEGIKIDEVARIRLSDLKELFQKAEEAKRASKRDEGADKLVFRTAIALQGVTYKVSYSSGWSYLLFVYTDRAGRYKEVKVFLKEEASNLGRGSVRYFLCPYTGHKCRTLFLDGVTIASRYAFKHYYSYQTRSRKERLLDKIFSTEHSNPERKGGKKTYQGRITRYGMKLQKYWEKAAIAYKSLEEYIKPTFRGRPPKGMVKREAKIIW